ncbi:hypothetical protein GIB67_040083 [Kingdonia uniflora]|uniref:GED domain-containing protein n=1 Tax=Kingdonia uniflora TaxID=39325 RepID=A0A7J7MUH0_9MAGN|nr:hypothetical protein GIB67_040083 [Kingdonia uniflora]
MQKHLETVIMSRIPGIQPFINKSIAELVSELSCLGKPFATDAGVHAILKELVRKAISDTAVKIIGSAALAYVNMVCGSLRNSISNSIIYCQVREAKRFLLDHYLAGMGKKEAKQFSSLLNEDPTVMKRRFALSKRLELYGSAEAEIDATAWAK